MLFFIFLFVCFLPPSPFTVWDGIVLCIIYDYIQKFLSFDIGFMSFTSTFLFQLAFFRV